MGPYIQVLLNEQMRRVAVCCCMLPLFVVVWCSRSSNCTDTMFSFDARIDRNANVTCRHSVSTRPLAHHHLIWPPGCLVFLFYWPPKNVLSQWIFQHLVTSLYMWMNLNLQQIKSPTRMHSSRMRTARSFTVSRSIRWGVGPTPLNADPLRTEWHTGAITLPCPKLRLRAVIIAAD